MSVIIDGSAGVTTNAGGSVNPSTTIDGINYSCRAWVNFNGIGTVAIRASGNVTNITDNGTGDYTVNFTTAMVDANYNYVSCCKEDNGGAADRTDKVVTANRETGQTTRLRVSSFQTTSGTRSDVIDVCISVFR